MEVNPIGTTYRPMTISFGKNDAWLADFMQEYCTNHDVRPSPLIRAALEEFFERRVPEQFHDARARRFIETATPTVRRAAA